METTDMQVFPFQKNVSRFSQINQSIDEETDMV